MNDKKSLRILLLSDGLPGHINQSQGLVGWMSARYYLQCQELNVSLRFKWLTRLLLPSILHLGWGNAFVLGSYSYRKEIVGKPDLIISTGGNTSFLNIALAQYWRIPNIFIGSRRRLRSNDFVAHLTLEPTGQPHNIVMDFAPNITDPSVLANQGQELRYLLGIQAEQKLYMLALGGDGAGYSYDGKACQQIALLMSDISRRDGCRWLLTTSRRSGHKFETTLKALIDPKLLADAVWWNAMPRKVMNAYMGAADQIFVSIDSMSMIGEGIASGKPVTLLQPEFADPESRYRQALDKYSRSGYCIIQPLDAPALPLLSITGNSADGKEKLLDKLDDMLAKYHS